MPKLEIKPIEPLKKPRKRVEKKKRKAYRTEPTLKQKRTFNKTLENFGNVSKAAAGAGYKKSVAKNPQVITRSKGWKQLCEEYLDDDKLAKVHSEGLSAITVVMRNNNETGEIESREIADYSVRHKYLDTAYKVKGKYSEDKLNESAREKILKELEDREALIKKKYGDRS